MRALILTARGIGDYVLGLPLLHGLKEAKVETDLIMYNPLYDKNFKKLLGNFANPVGPSKKEAMEYVQRLEKKGNYHQGLKVEHEMIEKLTEGKNWDVILFPRRHYEDNGKQEYTLNNPTKGKVINNIHLQTMLESNGRIPLHRTHKSEQYMLFLEYLGIPHDRMKFDMNIDYSQPVTFNDGTEFSSSENYVVLNLGASRPNKKWPAEYFAQVAEWLTNKGYKVVTIGTPFESKVAETIAKKTDILDATKIGIDFQNFARLAKDSDTVISNDTGFMHIADAVGANVIGLFAASNHLIWAPYHNREHLLSDYDSENFKYGSMDNIKPEKVIERLEKIIK